MILTILLYLIIMNYKFQFPPPIAKPEIQPPKHIPLSSLPSSIRSSKSDLNSPKSLIQPAPVLKIKPSRMSKKKKETRRQSSEKRSRSPAVKFTYINIQEENKEKNGVPPKMSKALNNFKKQKKEIQEVVTEQQIQAVNAEEENEKNEQKITNLVYTNEQYKDKIFSPSKQTNRLSPQFSSKRPKTEIQGKLQQEFYGSQDEVRENQKELMGIQKIQLEDLQKAKSEMLEESYRINTRKIKQLEQKNKQLVDINEIQKDKITSLHDQIFKLRSMKSINGNNKELGERKDDYQLSLREKQLEIKKLKNQIGLMKLRERQMQMKIKELEKRGQDGRKEKNGKEKRERSDF